MDIFGFRFIVKQDLCPTLWHLFNKVGCYSYRKESSTETAVKLELLSASPSPGTPGPWKCIFIFLQEIIFINAKCSNTFKPQNVRINRNYSSHPADTSILYWKQYFRGPAVHCVSHCCPCTTRTFCAAESQQHLDLLQIVQHKYNFLWNFVFKPLEDVSWKSCVAINIFLSPGSLVFRAMPGHTVFLFLSFFFFLVNLLVYQKNKVSVFFWPEQLASPQPLFQTRGVGRWKYGQGGGGKKYISQGRWGWK